MDTLTPDSTFVDIGANIGSFTVPAAQMTGPKGKVLALEASPRIISYLQNNVTVNCLRNVVIRHCAICDLESGDVEFYEAPVENFGMGALAAQFGVLSTSVPARTLDGLLAEEGIRSVDVLKVDVEGLEAAVFRGAKELLTSPAPPVVIFEFCDWAERRASACTVGDAQRTLASYGYNLWRLQDFPNGSPLGSTLVDGYEMLVATRCQAK